MKKLAKKLHQAAGPSSAGEAAPAASESVKQKDGFAVLAASFLVSELQVAFQIGFLILIPFLVVDLLVANALLVLGAEQVSHAIVSVPLKIFLFFALDGWFLVSQRLIGTYI
jgi:type III secretion protein R